MVSEMDEHFVKDHPLGGSFTHFETGQEIPFNETSTISTINLINAFNKTFVFYYLSNSLTKMIYFVIFLLGRKSDAENFCYELGIKSPSEAQRKVLF